MSRLIFAFIFMSLSAKAETVHFTCDSNELYHMTMTLHQPDALVDLNQQPQKLGAAHLSFYFVYKTYNWAQAETMSTAAQENETALLFKNESLNHQNQMLIKYSKQSDQATAVLDLYQNHFEFECQLTQQQKAKIF